METRIPLVTHLAVALGRAAAGPSWRPGALSHLSSYVSVRQMGKRSATADSDTKTQLTLPGKTWKSLWLPFILFASGAFRCQAGTEQRALLSRNSCGVPSGHRAAQDRLRAGAPGSAARCPLPYGMGGAALRETAGRGRHRPENAPQPEPPSAPSLALQLTALC